MITGGGVATSIDLGLYMVESLCGVEAVHLVQTAMDYPFYVTGQTEGDYIIYRVEK